MNPPPRISILAIRQASRRWRLRIPFHYGVVTLRDALELHLACDIEVSGGGRGTGFAAEVAAPKWFNKSPALTAAETVDRLVAAVAGVVRLAVRERQPNSTIAALAATLADGARTDSAMRRAGLNDLERSFAVSLVERAAIDALCRVSGASFPDLLRVDGLGLTGHWRHEANFPLERWLAALAPARRIAIRHTVGLADPLTRADVEGAADGRPVALEDVIGADGVSQFKVKLDGSSSQIEKLQTLAAILERQCPRYAVTLDANESFGDAASLAAITEAMAAAPALETFWSRVRHIEQPFERDAAFTQNIGGAALGKPLIIDESDATDDAFERAIACGYSGVSIKTCKGVTRSVMNAAYAAMLSSEGRPAFVSAEDLCVQPGIALHQNLALCGALGLTDAERNGHHYGPGPTALPGAERQQFQQAHPDLYQGAALRIDGGALSAASSLGAVGFGTAVAPEFNHLAAPRQSIVEETT